MIMNPEPGTPEWGKCGQCLQPLFLKRHPVGSQCPYAATLDGPQAPYDEAWVAKDEREPWIVEHARDTGHTTEESMTHGMRCLDCPDVPPAQR